LGVVQSGRPGAFFIDAPGGTGKSYVLNSSLAAVRLLTPDSIAIAVTVSGIATTLVLQGRFHSSLKAAYVYQRHIRVQGTRVAGRGG